MIALARRVATAPLARTPSRCRPIRWLAILPPIIMIGGAVVLLGRGLAGPPSAAGAGEHRRHRRHLRRRARRRAVAVVRRAGARGAHLRGPGGGDGRLQRPRHHAGGHRHAAQRAGGRRLPAPGGRARGGVPRAGDGVGLGRHVDGDGQRPHHRLPRPRDPLHRPLRAHRLQLPPGGLGRGGPQVLHPRRLLLGHLRLRHRADLRGHRLDEPDPDRRLLVQERGAVQRPACWPGSR